MGYHSMNNINPCACSYLPSCIYDLYIFLVIIYEFIVREWVYWHEIESQDGTFSWISYDVAFYQFSISNIKVLKMCFIN